MNVYIDETFFNHALMEKFIKHYPTLHLLDEQHITQAELLIVSPKMVKKDLLERMTNLKFIKLLTAGFDTVDLKYVKEKNIPIAYAKDVFSIQIAEDVFAKILYFNRKLGAYHEQSLHQNWTFVPSRHEIYDKHVLIVGAGSIGSEIALRMKAFGAHVTGYKKSPLKSSIYDQMVYETSELHDVLSEADYVIICLALNEQTYHFVDETFLSHMKKEALLINVARGDIIDQVALMNALNDERIRGAGLDVTSPEPLPADHPLWHAKNIFITPHQASSSPMMKARLMNEVIDTLEKFLSGEPLPNLIR